MNTPAPRLLRWLVAASLLASAIAGFDPSCTYTTEWSNSDKRMEGTASPLSGCQATQLKLSSTNDILLGGSGSANICGISAGSDGKGCDGGTDCMKWCEALCCMAPGCKHATIKKDTKTTDYVVYKETENKYYCRMYSSGSLKDSDSQSTCTKLGSTYCDELAYQSFKLNATQYESLVAAGAYATCPTSGRRLQQAGLPRPASIPRARDINAAIAAVFKPFAGFKARLALSKRKSTLRGFIKSSGVCQYAYPKLG